MMTHLLVWPEAVRVFQLNRNSYDKERGSNEFSCMTLEPGGML